MSEQTDNVIAMPNQSVLSLTDYNALLLEIRHYLHDMSQPLTVVSATIDLIDAGYNEEDDIIRARQALEEIFKIMSKLRNLPSSYSFNNSAS